MLLDGNELIGRTIHNRYQIQKIIGRGAAGVVYFAQDTMQPLSLAIKVFFPKEASEFDTQLYDILLQRFRREGALIAGLRHDHIVPVYEVDEYEGTAYFVMPYMNGGTLREKLRQQKVLSFDETLLYIRQAASALDFVHFHDIVHRDVKPQNFLLAEDGRLVLSDFGVAHVVESILTQPGQLWGTPAYASPEVTRGERVDRRDDIYSLGVVVYELLTGNHPGMVNQPHPNIPTRIESVIRKATDSRREERYASASALVEALKRATKDNKEEGEKTTPSLVQEAEQRGETAQRTKRPTSGTSHTELHIYLHRYLSRSPTTKSARNNSSIKRSSHYSRYILVSTGAALIVLLGYMLWNSLPRSAPEFTTFSRSYSISIGITATSPTSIPLPAKEVMTVIQQYYTDWNNKDYQAAYDLLLSDYKQAHTFDALLNNYKHTRYTCITIDRMNFLEDGTVQATVTDNAIEDTLSGGVVINRYTVDYLVEQEQGIWKLSPLSLQVNPGLGSCQAPTTSTASILAFR